MFFRMLYPVFCHECYHEPHHIQDKLIHSIYCIVNDTYSSIIYCLFIPCITYEDDKIIMSNIKNDVDDVADKVKAAAKAAANKVKDPDREFETEYQKEKMKQEDLKTQSAESTAASTSTTKVPRLNHSSIPQYKRILVPDDGSELSDKALSHAIYLSNSTGAEIVILNVIADIEKIEPTTISATTKEETEKGKEEAEAIVEGIENKAAKKDFQITMKGQAEQMVEERIRLCKEAGARNQISYKMQTGKKTVDEILALCEDMNIDLIVMASSKVTSPITGLASTTRKVIDGAKRPVLVIYEE
jgi:nucleotide-binding universal stress UspA family protein